MIHTERVRIDSIYSAEQTGGIAVDLLRLDLLHPVISGNKWFKLSPYLEEAAKQGKKTVLTRGGAWSNHILATAFACREAGMQCKLIIRGERPAKLSDTLAQALGLDAELVFLPRHIYRDKQLPQLPGIEEAYLIPEGGCGEAGITGAAGIAEYFTSENYDIIACAAGTGTTGAGLLRKLGANQELLVIPVLKGGEPLEDSIRQMAGPTAAKLQFHSGYHFGGYAKENPELINFMNEFFRATGVPADFVYTAKLFYAVNDLVRKNHFRPNQRILVIHSGGLQGNRSLEKGKLIFEDM